MQIPQIIEQNGIRVLTTRQLTEWYKTEEWQIKQNFRNNKDRFVLGKHYVTLQGEELKAFKSKVENIYLVGKTAKILYLWTEKGALLHAKSLNTDKAWEVYDYLVDYYFRAEEEKKPQTYREIREAALAEKRQEHVEKNIHKLPKINNPIRILKVLLEVAEDSGFKVGSLPFVSVDSILKGNHIGVRTGVTVEKACYELAWELSHAFIHYQNGNLINSPLKKDYDEQASRAADMIIKMLNVKMSQM